MEISKIVERIEKYEKIMQEVEFMLANYSEDKASALQKQVAELEAYYTSDEWKQDYNLDELGKLPKNLKRGVLSQDGIYNLLERYNEIKEEKKKRDCRKRKLIKRLQYMRK